MSIVTFKKKFEFQIFSGTVIKLYWTEFYFDLSFT